MEFFFRPHGRFDRYVEIADIDLTFTTIACFALRFGRLERGFGGLFLDLLRRWSNRSRFCGKQEKAAPPPTEEEMCSEPANERVEGDEQSEAPEPPKEEEATVGGPGGAEQPQQGAMDDTWDDFE